MSQWQTKCHCLMLYIGIDPITQLHMYVMKVVHIERKSNNYEKRCFHAIIGLFLKEMISSSREQILSFKSSPHFEKECNW